MSDRFGFLKPSNWRRYYGYRPTAFAPVPRSKEKLVQLADAYTTWLAESRGWSIVETRAYIATQKTGPAAVVAKTEPAPEILPLLAA